MADDRDAWIAELEAELRQSRDENAALRAERDGLADEVQDLRPALTEALEQQTATAEILRVILTSPTDAQPVLDAIVQSAMRLSDSPEAQIAIREGDHLRLAAMGGGLGWHREIGT